MRSLNLAERIQPLLLALSSPSTEPIIFTSFFACLLEPCSEACRASGLGFNLVILGCFVLIEVPRFGCDRVCDTELYGL